VFRRDLNLDVIKRLRDSRLYTEKLKPDIDAGVVFPAIRDGYIDFYHNGGRLFTFKQNFSTHRKYASVIKSKNDYVSEADIAKRVKLITDFCDGYEEIKENCSLYSGVEAEGVSRLYHKYPFTKNDVPVVVLDIEVSFEARSKDRNQDRIDILLFNKDTQQLRFYEAKHYSNGELWAAEGNPPKVVSQIKRYQEHIAVNGDHILSQYCNYVRIMNDLLGCNLPEPKSIDEKVTLFVFGYDRDQQKGRMQKLLFEDQSLAGIQYYFIGNVSAVKIGSMWKAVKCG
jgi:hypothetical protein